MTAERQRSMPLTEPLTEAGRKRLRDQRERLRRQHESSCRGQVREGSGVP